MLTWIIQISLISIIFIFLVHHLLMFFKTTLTVPKIKDLVNSPNQKYQNIYDTLNSTSANKSYISGYTDIDLLPSSDKNDITSETNSMKNELKSFLKKQLNVNSDFRMDTISGNFSNF